MHLIELQSITKYYGNLLILKDINLTVDRGTSYAITGNSGTGKSTLMHILSFIDTKAEGNILLEGKPITEKDDRFLSKLRNEKFGFIFQENYLIPEYTALENIIVPALIKGCRRSVATESALDLLENCGLSDRAKHYPSELSSGEKQRVSLCRALVNNPEVVFADEPTGSLDEENAESVENFLLETVEKKNKTLVLITHNPDFAEKCQCIFRIKNHALIKEK